LKITALYVLILSEFFLVVYLHEDEEVDEEGQAEVDEEVLHRDLPDIQVLKSFAN